MLHSMFVSDHQHRLSQHWFNGCTTLMLAQLLSSGSCFRQVAMSCDKYRVCSLKPPATHALICCMQLPRLQLRPSWHWCYVDTGPLSAHVPHCLSCNCLQSAYEKELDAHSLVVNKIWRAPLSSLSLSSLLVFGFNLMSCV